MMQFEVTPEGKVVCAWFALCDNEATGVVEHPVLEYVPTCQRCADKADLVLIPASFDFS